MIIYETFLILVGLHVTWESTRHVSCCFTQENEEAFAVCTSVTFPNSPG